MLNTSLADDKILFSKFDDELSLKHLLNVNEAFKKVSGHNINLYKSEIISINVNSHLLRNRLFNTIVNWGIGLTRICDSIYVVHLELSFWSLQLRKLKEDL